MKTKDELYKIWNINSRKPGWLRSLWLTGEFTEEELDLLSDIDEDFLEIARNAEKEWYESKKANQPKTEHEWFEVFPEAKTLIRPKIQEWQAQEDEAKHQVEKALRIINTTAPPEDQWFWREILKHLFEPVKRLAEATKQISRLKFVMKGKTTVNNWENAKAIAKNQDIISVIERHGIRLKRAGRLFKANCPFHSERTPSFFVNPNKQSFTCYGCGIHGDVITFVQLINKCSFKEAINKLQLI